MIGSIDFKTDGDKITIGVFGKDAPKADGHNNLSGASSLPIRRFLPEVGESYTGDIKKLILDEIRKTKAESADISDKLEDVESSEDLYEVLRGVFVGETKARIKEAVLGTALREVLDEFDLLDLL